MMMMIMMMMMMIIMMLMKYLEVEWWYAESWPAGVKNAPRHGSPDKKCPRRMTSSSSSPGNSYSVTSRPGFPGNSQIGGRSAQYECRATSLHTSATRTAAVSTPGWRDTCEASTPAEYYTPVNPAADFRFRGPTCSSRSWCGADTVKTPWWRRPIRAGWSWPRVVN